LTDLTFQVDRSQRGKRDEKAKGRGPITPDSIWILIGYLVKAISNIDPKIIEN